MLVLLDHQIIGGEFILITLELLFLMILARTTKLSINFY